MLDRTTICRSIRRIDASICSLALLVAFLAACQDASAPAPLPPTPARLAFTPLGELFAGGAPQPKEITTAGSLMVDHSGAVLVEELTFDAAGKPRPLATGIAPIWLGADADASLKGALRSAGGIQYATVIARGRLEGPGSYGAGGRYQYQISAPTLEPLAAQESTIAELLDRPAGYDGRLIRIIGGLLARDSAALLVERIGAGGLPEPKARQIKLRGPLRDQELLGRLKGTPGGTVHFGQVQIEGFWRGGSLVPLSITLVT